MNLQFRSKILPRANRWSAVLVAIFVFIAGPVAAQSANDGYQPNADGEVRALAVAPDQSTVYVGNFLFVSNVQRTGIVRVRHDGTVDAGFQVSTNGTPYSVAIAAASSVLVGGDFTLAGGANPLTPRTHLARFNQAGVLDAGFAPSINGAVRAITVQGDGRILIGGEFNSVGGQPRFGIARLLANGQLDAGFVAPLDGVVRSILVESDGRIFIGGSFSSTDGSGLSSLLFVESTGARVTSVGPAISGPVNQIVRDAIGNIVFGGGFNAVNGFNHRAIARLTRVTFALDNSFTPDVSGAGGSLGDVRALLPLANGDLLLGGDFLTIGAASRQRVARLSFSGQVIDDFQPQADGAVNALGIQADGGLLLAGAFNAAAGVTRGRMARLYDDGSIDQDFIIANDASDIRVMARQSNGRILVAGNFSTINSQVIAHLVGLRPDGRSDNRFVATVSSTAFNQVIRAICVQADDRVLIAGDFTQVSGVSATSIVRLLPNGEYDASFVAPAGLGPVESVAVDRLGRIYVGGRFTTPRTAIARLSSAGVLDASFSATLSTGVAANAGVFALLPRDDGRLWVGGTFLIVNGVARENVVLLNADGSTAPQDNLGITNGSVRSGLAFAAESAGSVLAAGSFRFLDAVGINSRGIVRMSDAGVRDPLFQTGDNALGREFRAIVPYRNGGAMLAGFFGDTFLNGVIRPNMILIQADGRADAAFNAQLSISDELRSLLLQPDGKLLTAGSFTLMATVSRNRIARLRADAAATQVLTVTQNEVRWALGGRFPLLLRAPFEVSLDGISWNPLGDATRQGEDWVLAVNLPITRNLFVRARGLYSSDGKGGTSLVESVRMVYFNDVVSVEPLNFSNGFE